MRLFELDDEGMVMLNKVWIQLIPDLNKLITRDKGSKGDYRGSLKLKARKEFTYIYFYCDFNSPIRDWEDGERHKEALYYAGIESVDEDVMTARVLYDKLIMKGTRSIRTYKALMHTVDELDNHFETLDFTAINKRTGEPLNSPDSVAKGILQLQKVHAAVRSFEKQVEEDMKSGLSGIRGTAELGDNEATDNGPKKEWSELDIMEGSTHVQEKAKGIEVPEQESKAGTTLAKFMDMASVVKSNNEFEISEEEIAAALAEEEGEK